MVETIPRKQGNRQRRTSDVAKARNDRMQLTSDSRGYKLAANQRCLNGKVAVASEQERYHSEKDE